MNLFVCLSNLMLHLENVEKCNKKKVGDWKDNVEISSKVFFFFEKHHNFWLIFIEIK